MHSIISCDRDDHRREQQLQHLSNGNVGGGGNDEPRNQPLNGGMQNPNPGPNFSLPPANGSASGNQAVQEHMFGDTPLEQSFYGGLQTQFDVEFVGPMQAVAYSGTVVLMST